MKATMRLGRQFGHWMLVLVLGLSTGTALADVVVIVSSSSPVASLGKNQLADIFLGKVARFPGGREAVPIDQKEGTVERDEFYIRFIGKSSAQMKAYWSKVIFTGRGQPPREMADSSDVKKQIAENPNAIGYIDRADVDASVRILQLK